jgi:hypothetical protein
VDKQLQSVVYGIETLSLIHPMTKPDFRLPLLLSLSMQQTWFRRSLLTQDRTATTPKVLTVATPITMEVPTLLTIMDISPTLSLVTTQVATTIQEMETVAMEVSSTPTRTMTQGNHTRSLHCLTKELSNEYL